MSRNRKTKSNTYTADDALSSLRAIYNASNEAYHAAGDKNKIYDPEFFDDLIKNIGIIQQQYDKAAEDTTLYYYLSALKSQFGLACNIEDANQMMTCLLEAARICESALEILFEISQSLNLKSFSRTKTVV